MATYEVNTQSNLVSCVIDSFGDLEKLLHLPYPQWQYELMTKLSQIVHSNVGGIGWGKKSFQLAIWKVIFK